MTGAANLLLAVAMWSLEHDPGCRTLAVVNGTAGAASVGSAVWAASRRRPAGSASPHADGAEPASRPVELSLGPGLAPSPWGGRGRPWSGGSVSEGPAEEIDR